MQSTSTPNAKHIEVLADLTKAIESKCPASIEDGLLTLEDGHTIDLVAIKQALRDLMHANVALVEEFTTGRCYDTRNPYRRPCVMESLGVFAQLIAHPDPTFCLDDFKQTLNRTAPKRESYLVAAFRDSKGILAQTFAPDPESAMRAVIAAAVDAFGGDFKAEIVDKHAMPGLWLEGDAEYIKQQIKHGL